MFLLLLMHLPSNLRQEYQSHTVTLSEETAQTNVVYYVKNETENKLASPVKLLHHFA